MRVAVLNREDIFPEGYNSPLYSSGTTAAPDADYAPYEFESLEEVERKHILKALTQVNWHKGKACDLLKISRPTLNKKIKKYGLG